MAAPRYDDGELTCPDCGAMVIGGREGCQKMFDELGFIVYQTPSIARFHRLIVDCYAMQHVERYGLSAKSYAAHLTGLCVAIEHGGDAAINEAVRCMLDGKAEAIVKPEIIEKRGEITIVDVLAAPDMTHQVEIVKAWAASIWGAYESQHALARRWIEDGLARQGPVSGSTG